MHKNSRGKWVVSVQDPLVKKTGDSRSVGSVEDSFALRTAPGRRLVMGTATNLNGFTTGSPIVDSYIVDSSRRYGIDPLLIYSQMHQESTFK
ncbi:MAG TPA: hypothetical protein VL327_06635, partial [Pyrinomonadaceae bacterium]|nr:hypothetical protein [Pyrinomonadaceae bacterium]